MDGKGMVENVVGKGGQPVGRDGSLVSSVQVELVVVVVVALEGEVGATVDGTPVVVVLVQEVELLEDGKGGRDVEDCVVVVVMEVAEVLVGPVAVELVREETEVLDGMESDELVGIEVDELVVDMPDKFVDEELEMPVGTPEAPVSVVDAFKDVDGVSVGCPEGALFAVEVEDSVALPDKTMEPVPVGTEDVIVPVLPGLLAVAPVEVVFPNGGEQHEDENGVLPPEITVTITLLEIVTSVGLLLPLVPGVAELDGDAKVLEDGGIRPVPGRLVAFALTDREPVPIADGPGLLVMDEELLRSEENVYGGRAENEEIEKPRNVDELVAVALLPDIVPAPEVVHEVLFPSVVVAAGLPPVALMAPGLSEVLLAVAVKLAALEREVLLLSVAGSVVDWVAAVDEPVDNVADTSDVELAEVDVSVRSPLVLFTAVDQGNVIETVPLANG